MNLRSLPILLLLAAGCGTNLGAKQRARNACPTLTEAEFRIVWDVAVLDRDLGGTREAVLANLAQACYDPYSLDRIIECRTCLTAITEGVY